MQLKTLSQRPKTLRGSIRPTPASLHLEITMLLHQERRCRSELDVLRAREKELETLIKSTRQRVRSLRVLSDHMDPGSSGRDMAAPQPVDQNCITQNESDCNAKREVGLMAIEY